MLWGARLDHWNLSPHTAKKDIQDKFDLYEEAECKRILDHRTLQIKRLEVFFYTMTSINELRHIQCQIMLVATFFLICPSISTRCLGIMPEYLSPLQRSWWRDSGFKLPMLVTSLRFVVATRGARGSLFDCHRQSNLSIGHSDPSDTPDPPIPRSSWYPCPPIPIDTLIPPIPPIPGYLRYLRCAPLEFCNLSL